MRIHTRLGPGLLESVYATCLAYELNRLQIPFRTEVPVPVVYADVRLDCGFRADMVVEDSLLLELKSIEKVLPVHHAQVLTYLRLLGLGQGLLINFNVTLLKSGLKNFLM